MTTLQDAYLDLRAMLRARGISAPDLAARELMGVRLGLSKTEMTARGGLYLAEETVHDLRRMAERHMEGEPLAYILGQWDFFGLTLEVTPDVLIPRPDTELLAELAITNLEWRVSSVSGALEARVLDLCCGSGCVGLALAAKRPEIDLTLADTSPKALALAERNAVRLGAEARCMCADALEPPAPALGQFDVIVCNPPYISDAEFEELDRSVRGYEPEAALRGGVDGLDFYRAVVRHWHGALRPGGTLLFEVGYRQAGEVADLMRFGGYIHVSAHRDHSGIERVVIGHKNP